MYFSFINLKSLRSHPPQTVVQKVVKPQSMCCPTTLAENKKLSSMIIPGPWSKKTASIFDVAPGNIKEHIIRFSSILS